MTGARTQLILALVAAVISVGGALFFALVLIGHMRETQSLPGERADSLAVLSGMIERVDASSRSLVVSVENPFGEGVLRYQVAVDSPALLVRTMFETRGGAVTRLSAQNARTVSADLREFSPGLPVRVIGTPPEQGQGYLAQFITANEFIEGD